MIRFVMANEPPDFDEKVRRPGQRWLAENPPGGDVKKRPPSYWLSVHEDVATAFGDLCAYTCMWLSHAGEIDHYISFDEDPALGYEWRNYRYTAGWLNKSKKSLRSSQLLDPFDVEDGWFEILLPSLQLVITEQCPEHLRERANLMLERLHLRDGSRVMRSRRAFYKEYESRKDSDPNILDWLESKAPLIARAIRKQQAVAAV